MKNNNNIKWPDIWNVPDSVEWISNGSNFHSKAARVKWNGIAKFLKVYGLAGKEDSFTSIQDIESLIANIAEYRLQLINANVNVPNSCSYTITSNGNSNLLYLLESDCGDCLLTLLKRMNWSGYDSWLERISHIIASIMSSSVSNSLSTGIDPKISNFVVNNNKLSYVDMVWPLNKSSLNYIHTDMSKVWEFRYFSKIGLLINWIIQFSRLNLSNYRLTKKYILTQAKLFLNDKDFEVLSEYCDLEKGEIGQKLERIPLWNVDILRLLGVALSVDSNDYSFMDEIFSLSRTNPHEPLPTQMILKCRDLLNKK